MTAYDKRFNRLCEIMDRDVVLFCFCALLNLRYDPEIQFQVFEEYRQKMDDTLFEDGETDIETILTEKMSDHERWIAEWGVGSEDNPYTDTDYRRLDELFKTYSNRLIRSGNMDMQSEYTVRATCQDQLLAEKCRAIGDKEHIDMYTKINKTILDRLGAENMRKKDEKPMESLRLDSIVDALQRAGLMRRGKLLSLEELQEQLLRRLGALGGSPSHKYPYTLDAADQMIFMIQNNMYANDNIPEVTEVQENLMFDDNVACEFAGTPNNKELEAYKKMGLQRHREN